MNKLTAISILFLMMCIMVSAFIGTIALVLTPELIAENKYLIAGYTSMMVLLSALNILIGLTELTKVNTKLRRNAR